MAVDKISVTSINKQIEINVDNDGTISLDVLKIYFPEATSLCFLNSDGNKEALRINNNKIYLKNDIKNYEARIVQGK